MDEDTPIVADDIEPELDPADGDLDGLGDAATGAQTCTGS